MINGHQVQASLVQHGHCAGARDLSARNATIPLTTINYNQSRNETAESPIPVLIGHPGHQPPERTMSQRPGPVYLVQNVSDVAVVPLPTGAPMAYIRPTTLGVDDAKDIFAALHARFTDIQGPEIRDICYATQNRQTAVRDLSKLVDVILLVGAANSSNSNRLRETGADAGIARSLIADGSELNPEWLKDVKAVGIAAGASAPEVDDVIEALRHIGPVTVPVIPGREENIEFRLPAAPVAG